MYRPVQSLDTFLIDRESEMFSQMRIALKPFNDHVQDIGTNAKVRFH